MIWRRQEGERMRYGLNWGRDARTHLVLMLVWRTCTRRYAIGFRLRTRAAAGPHRRLLVRPLRSSCLFCDVALDVVCAKDWRVSDSRY